jgi:hypothetical protein
MGTWEEAIIGAASAGAAAVVDVTTTVVTGAPPCSDLRMCLKRAMQVARVCPGTAAPIRVQRSWVGSEAG